jgi:predicted nuclease of restriction endonuclease-like (RecB) superfamily
MTELQPTTPTGYAELLLELGMGFAFVGSQYRLAVRGSEFYVDLLFCHLRLRAYLVVDLKLGLSRRSSQARGISICPRLVNGLLRHPDD